MTTNGRAPDKKPINIALQGGGSHGAFSWGVLDRLIEDGRLEFAAISGTSAGAMNAVALADGWVRGGADGARQKLYDFWRAVAQKGRFSPVQRTPWDVAWGNWSVENTPGYIWYDAVSRMLSPYVANPLNLNPLGIIFAFLSSAFVPRANLPGWADAVASVNPMTAFADASRAAMIGDLTSGRVAWGLSVGVVLASGSLALAHATLARTLRKDHS